MTIKLHLLLALALTGVQTTAQQIPLCSVPVEYGNRNQVDPNPLFVRTVSGRVFMEARRTLEDLGPIPGGCLALFTESDHKLIESTVADENGRFAFKRLSTGRYRLVARDPKDVFCMANAPIQIVEWPRGGIFARRQIVVHMQAAGIDTCSYADYK